MYGTFTNVDEYCLDLIPFDQDVLSMEMETAFRVRRSGKARGPVTSLPFLSAIACSPKQAWQEKFCP